MHNILGWDESEAENWARSNRAPLYPGKVQRWIVLGTLADDPTEKDLQRMLGAWLVRLFEGHPWSATVLVEERAVDAPISSVKVERISKTRIAWPDVTGRRETLPYGPIATVRSPAVWLQVSFAYNGLKDSLAWPVRSASAGWFGVQTKTASVDPIGADWVVDSVSLPGSKAPETISRAGAVLETATGEVVDLAAAALRPARGLLFGLGALAAGLLFWRVRK